jgi:hypothetical protein
MKLVAYLLTRSVEGHPCRRERESLVRVDRERLEAGAHESLEVLYDACLGSVLAEQGLNGVLELLKNLRHVLAGSPMYVFFDNAFASRSHAYP